MNLYIITFNDKSKFYGGDYKKPKWLEIPLKKIKEIIYFTPLGRKIHLKGYDKYYHFVEVTTDLNGKNRGKRILDCTYLIAKKDDIYKVHKISLETGKIEIQHLREEDKLIKQLNPIGWR